MHHQCRRRVPSGTAEEHGLLLTVTGDATIDGRRALIDGGVDRSE